MQAMQQELPFQRNSGVRWLWPVMAAGVLSACVNAPLRAPSEVQPANVRSDAVLTPATRITRDLVNLPEPEYKMPVAVYSFRDQTGQFRPQPESNLSNAVTQGAASILVKALLDSGWYLPIEREGLQNLLNERRIARTIEVPADKGKPGSSYPAMLAANYILEGGIVGYEQNVRTGGEGANLLGIGGDTKYQVDQVTVNLRSVDVRTGQVVNSVSVTKTIFSQAVNASVYKFVSYKTLLQVESGYTNNEPGQLAVKEAIESAVIHLTVQGVRDGVWALKNEQDWSTPLVQNYLKDAENSVAATIDKESDNGGFVAKNPRSRLVLPPQRPLHLQSSQARREAETPVTVAPTPSRTEPKPEPAATRVPTVPTVAPQPTDSKDQKSASAMGSV